VSTIFTAGVRTNGRVEGENRVNKCLTGPKKTFRQVFDALNERAEEQSKNDLISVRQYAGPYALQTAYTQMEQSVYYKTEVVQLPMGMRNWTTFNTFDNDEQYISTKWILRLVQKRGLKVKHLLKISHGSSKTASPHYIVVIDPYQHVCDCGMGLNLGIPCRHYFQALTATRGAGLLFHIGLV
ncbi:hypothetical protein C8Q76DRAFT_583522, partial [Earliella scabrosa]